MSDMEAREAEHRMAAINAADEWLAEHRVNESWRMINRLRDQLVRSSNTYSAGFHEGIRQAREAVQGVNGSGSDNYLGHAIAVINALEEG